MSLSIFDLFKVGVGPSSSHTIGPMWAANRFLLELDSHDVLERVHRVRADLYGSLALTGNLEEDLFQFVGLAVRSKRGDPHPERVGLHSGQV